MDKLQEDNIELNQFLKSCKCSKIKKNIYSEESLEDSEEVVEKYERRLLNAEKEFIREEMVLREGMHRKDQCIDRLNLVISEMKKCRYESVDQLTE